MSATEKPSSAPATPSPTPTPAVPAPAAGVSANARMYGLFTTLTAAVMLGLLFAPWLTGELAKDAGGSKAGQTLLKPTGINLITGSKDSFTAKTIDGLRYQKDSKGTIVREQDWSKFSPTPVEVLESKFVEPVWVKPALMAYAGVLAVTALLGLVNAIGLVPALGGRAFGGVLLVAGLVCMIIVGAVLLLGREPPAEPAGFFVDKNLPLKFKPTLFSLVSIAMGFLLLGMGPLYVLTGAISASAAAKPKTKLAGSAKSAFLPPE